MPRNIPDPAVDNPALEASLKKSGVGLEKTRAEAQPIYRVMQGSKIPVSKHMGNLWASRRDQGVTARGCSESRWTEAIRYYENDQTQNRVAKDNSAGNTANTQKLNNQYTETENVVFANCSIMVPMLYAKNPHITATSDNDAHEPLCRLIERLGNKLLSMKNAPGLNFKSKGRRMVLTTLLTNSAFIKIGWVAKQDSDAAALAQLQGLAQELQTATSRKKIIELEGKIMALEEKVSLLSPSGPFCRNLTPDRLVVDPTSSNPDLSDANWVMEWDMLPTSYINAVYATKDDEQYRSTYEPTHILNRGAGNVDDGGDGGASALDDVVNNFSLITTTETTAASFGYSSPEAFKAAQYTKVWYVWDKVTRRVYMFADNSWKWPVWVWDDPLQLPRFFPYFRLWFHESTNASAPKGEVTYYLDQQDAINEIGDEERRARAWAKRNILFDKDAISQTDVEVVLSGPDGTARGVELKEGFKISDAIFSFAPPSMKFPELFNKDGKFAAINRITGVNDAMRGAQFKTNTTNKAIDFYGQAVEVRTDEKTDLIEDVIGDMMWNILMLCMMNWEAEDVAPFVGIEMAKNWQRVTDNRMFDSLLHVRVEGGSTEKPNSKAKKQMAGELGQVLGQFAGGAPFIALPMLKMFERAFDEFVISDEEWQMIIQSIQQTLMNTGGTGQQGQAGAPQEGQPQQGGGDEEIRQAIESLPDEAKAALEQMVQQGMSPSEALQQVMQATQSTVQ